MADNGQWADINKCGSGTPPPRESDNAPDAQEAIDNANRASRLHQEANRLAEK